MKSSPYRLGFTLIEIISVLVILGILADMISIRVKPRR